MNSSFVVIPVRGLSIADEELPEDLFVKDWHLLGKRQIHRLEKIPQKTNSLAGKISMICNRLSPDSLLLVRYFEGERSGPYDENKAEKILAALCLSCLLWKSAIPGTGIVCHAVYRARYKELCDLPLSFDQEQVLTTGHTGRLGLLTSGEHHPPVLFKDLLSHVETCPSTIQKLLTSKELNKRERRLISAARGILAAFDATSVGAFLSACITAVETLVDSQSDDPTARDRSWRKKETRLRLVVGNLYLNKLSSILKERHQFVHTGAQPKGPCASESALAVAVQTWVVIHELYSRFGSVGDAEAYMDCCVSASRTKSDELDDLRRACQKIPEGPVMELHWIRKHLIDLHPNKYTRKYFHNDMVNCPSCGHSNGHENVIAENSFKKTVQCHFCKKEWEAFDTPHR